MACVKISLPVYMSTSSKSSLDGRGCFKPPAPFKSMTAENEDFLLLLQQVTPPCQEVSRTVVAWFDKFDL